MNERRIFWITILAIAGVWLLAACTTSPSPAAQVEQADEEEHTEEVAEAESEEHADDEEHREETESEEHADEEAHMMDGGHTHSPDQHMAGMHNVPEEAAVVPNPIVATDESVEAGEQIFAINCAVCHGQSGHGDGPGAAGLEKPPANLTEAHVQELSDGALFYIVSHGRPDTPMPAWDNTLNEEQRWQTVNYLRTFKEGEAQTDDEHHEEESEHQEDGEHHEEN